MEEFTRIAINTFANKIPGSGLDIQLMETYDGKYNKAFLMHGPLAIPKMMINYFLLETKRMHSAIRN